MDRSDALAWVGGYEQAWRTRGTIGLAELFTADATYRTAPFEEPFRGLDEIQALWERGRDRGEVFTLDAEVVAVEGDTAVVRLEVRYTVPAVRRYRDLWILRFDGGRCRSFEEWPFWPPGSPGSYERHPG